MSPQISPLKPFGYKKKCDILNDILTPINMISNQLISKMDFRKLKFGQQIKLLFRFGHNNSQKGKS